MTSTSATRRRRIADVHRTVLEAVRRLGRRAPAMRVRRISTAVGRDARTVRNHLDMMVQDGLGVFLDEEREVFGLVEPLAVALRRAIREPYARMGLAAVNRVWDNEYDADWNL